jgi:predicted GNAT superfamily acetyltransferase
LVAAAKGTATGSSGTTKHRRFRLLTLVPVARTEAAGSTISARLVEQWDDLEAAVDVILGVWGDGAVALASPALLRTYSHYGNPVIGAFVDDVLCGVSIGFLASAPEVHLHSHITGVLPAYQHLGIGYELKTTQRAWCREHGIALVTWTFDPMLARNAHFNLRKLGAVARRLLPSFYGAMDDDINRGDATDRLEVQWDVAGGGRAKRDIIAAVAIPPDYLALRAADPDAADASRAEVRERLLAAFDDGLEIVDFSRDDGYLLARR